MKIYGKVLALCLLAVLLLSSCGYSPSPRYTSARMKTQGNKDFLYGRIEARIKVPLGQGIWPAFWMLGDSFSTVGWPKCGEIDIMEHVNNTDRCVGTIHWDINGNYSQHGNSTVVSNITDWHKYRIDWTPSYIKWYVDDAITPYNTANITINSTEEFHGRFFIILNLAVGGKWPGYPDSTTTFPQKLCVDYIRVYNWRQEEGEEEGTFSDSPDWQDEFNNIDTSIWKFEIGNNNGWGNNELQYYTDSPENAYIENDGTDSYLVIKAIKN